MAPSAGTLLRTLHITGASILMLEGSNMTKLRNPHDGRKGAVERPGNDRGYLLMSPELDL